MCSGAKGRGDDANRFDQIAARERLVLQRRPFSIDSFWRPNHIAPAGRAAAYCARNSVRGSVPSGKGGGL